jgi:hypothetical protein
MGVPTSEVGYTSATTGRQDHKDNKGHVRALEKNHFIIVNGEEMLYCVIFPETFN